MPAGRNPPALASVSAAREALQEALPLFHSLPALADCGLAAWPAATDAAQLETGEFAAGRAVQGRLDALIETLRPKDPNNLSTTDQQVYQVVDGLFRRRRRPKELMEELYISRSCLYERRSQGLRRMAETLVQGEGPARPQWLRDFPPPSYSRLFGVQPLIETLLACFRDASGHALICLIGFGGLGKTAVARESAWQALQSGLVVACAWQTAVRRVLIAGDILEVNRPALTSESLLNGLAESLDAPKLVTLPSVLKRRGIKELLASRPTLVVVDNLETSADIRAITDLLADLSAVPGARLLVTSRQRMTSSAQVFTYRLQPLDEANTLLLARASAEASGDHQLAEADDYRLRPIYTVTGGNPLAVKLIVGQAGVLPLEQALDQVRRAHGPGEKLYDFLLLQSWKLLSPAARLALYALASLGGRNIGWKPLIFTSGLSAETLARSLVDLANFSLVEVTGAIEPSYTIHPLISHFLLSSLPGGWDAPRERPEVR